MKKLITCLTAVAFLAVAFLGSQLKGQNLSANVAGNNNFGTTVQLPVVGVSIDADGVMTAREFRDEDGQMAANIANAKRNLNGQIQQQSVLRKVSLRRLETAVQAKLANGDPITDEMKVLAGTSKDPIHLCPTC